METVQDFEDILRLLETYQVKYLIVGGLAFIYHAKPRYTKDMDLWIDPSEENVDRANRALEEFGSPILIDRLPTDSADRRS
ncbi:MAG: nucleotidyltransferase domain-containing protein [Acidobacteriota bacterium]